MARRGASGSDAGAIAQSLSELETGVASLTTRLNGVDQTMSALRTDLDAARKAARKFDPERDLKQVSTEGMNEDQAWWVTATVADVIKKYIEEVVVNFRTRYETERCFNRYIIPALGRKVFVDLKKSDAGQMRRNMRRTNGPRQADIPQLIIIELVQPVHLRAIAQNAKSGCQRRESGHETLGERRGELAAVEF